MKYKKKNSVYLVIIFFLVVSIGLGYSFINTTLGINSSLTFAKFEGIYFDNLVVHEGSVTSVVEPSLDKVTAKTNFKVTLTDISDSYVFDLNVVNEGYASDKLTEIIMNGLTAEQSQLVDYTVTYSDGTELEINDLLVAGAYDTITVTVKWKEGIDSVTAQTMNLYLELVYTEDDGNGESRFKSLYQMMADQAVMDNVSSTYVTAETGINFARISSDTNGKGVYTRAGTENDEFPIHYYRGNVTDNNVLFGGFCWKIVRTTETGGTKLIYNGEPTKSWACNNTGEDSQIGSSMFNSYENADGLARTGYMYGSSFYISSNYFDRSLNVIDRLNVGTDVYYYGDSVLNIGGLYVLQNPRTISWTGTNDDLIGMYTCRSENLFACTKVYYIVKTEDSSIYTVNLDSGKSLEETNIVLGTTTVNNGDGTLSLGNVVSVPRLEWYTNFENYKNYYACEDLVSSTCDSILYVYSTYSSGLSYKIGHAFLYGNDVSWDGEKYSLVDTYTSDLWENDKSKIATKYHYTCFNTNGFCEKVYYIVDFSSNSYIYYFSLKDGNDIESLKMEAFTNTSDSAIKEKIDLWYEKNMIDYAGKLENTVWCNDRSVVFGPLKSKDEDSSINYITYFGGKARDKSPSVICPQLNDSFTLSVEAGGIEAYGNNSLKYPVGLLTVDELRMAGLSDIYSNVYSFLYTGLSFWTMSPYNYSNIGNGYCVNVNGRVYSCGFSGSYGVRPSISLFSEIMISGGNGSATKPYIVG